jgi:Zn-dependent peptidase ImmA (M78 family)
MTPEELLRKHRISQPPVPVEKLAKLEGLIICPLPASDEISGAIVRKGAHVVVAVNPSHAPTRRRFTIAHELGHYFLHGDLMEHVDQDFRVSWRDANSSRAVNWKEIEANRFAAKLLMPTAFLKGDLNTLRVIDEKAIQQLAKKYQVSPLAMQIRLTNLGLIPDIVRPHDTL